MKLAILYRGSLSSCNYGCRYCPFAKRKESRAEHAADRQALERFVNWVESRAADRLSIFFTPWGEALIHPRYQHALARLTHFQNVDKAAIQTNLAGRLDWVEKAHKPKLALWTTFHPSQISRARFLEKCRELDQRGISYSVGVVGLKENMGQIAALRQELAPPVYLWINAYKARPDYYTGEKEVLEFFEKIDPLFGVNNTAHPSRGKLCQTGHTVISVDEAGQIQRCHFVKTNLGNIYDPAFEQLLKPRPCPKASCDCHIGYVHLPHLQLDTVFQAGILERIPANPLWQPLTLINKG